MIGLGGRQGSGRWLLAAGALAIAALVGGILFWPASHGSRPIRHGDESCAKCRMPVGSPGYAGMIRDAQGAVTVYDDIGCLVEALRAVKDAAREVYVEDRAAGGLIPWEAATIVRSSETTPMGSGLVAFADVEAARRYARDHKGELVTVDAVVAATRPAAAAVVQAQPGSARPFTDADAREGKAIFRRECSACHGERGEGDGPAAAFLPVPPRNLARGKFRVRTTPSGTAPASADILGTIERGMPGSGMPAFDFLAPEERRQVAAYVLDVAGLLEEKEPQPIAEGGAPPASTPEHVAKGHEAYEALRCGQCHGPSGKGDGPSARTLKDDTDRIIPARDLTAGIYRGGADRRALFYRLSTGMDGTPMPGYAEAATPEERWAVADYVLSLKKDETPPAPPADALRAGRMVTARHSCRACHILDDGKGGEVGPDLRISGQKLAPEWIRAFLKAPRAQGKIYPWRPHRMPDLKLPDAEVETLVAYLGVMGKRTDKARPPAPARVAEAAVTEGKNLYVLRCAQCHTLGKVIETPVATQQGPDLIRASARLDHEWILRFVQNPKTIDPKSRMTVPGLTPDQVKVIRDFVWQTSVDQGAASEPRATGGDTSGGGTAAPRAGGAP